MTSTRGTTGMVDILSRWRRLVNDSAGIVWTDDEALDILDNFRRDLRFEPMSYKPRYEFGTVTYRDYFIGAGNLEGAESGTVAFMITDGGGTPISSGWSADYRRGVVTFDADQKGSVRYVDARSFDIDGAAAEGWRELMATKASLYKFTADGASFDRDQWFTHCSEMVKMFDARATSASPKRLVSFGRFVRTDVRKP